MPDDKAAEDPDVPSEDAAGSADDDNHEEATEILSDLLRNQAAAGAAGMVVPSPQPPAAATDGGNSAEGTQVGEAQQAAMQQMMSQLAMQGVNVQAIDTSSLLAGRAEAAGQSGDKKHAFWDTQVRLQLGSTRDGGVSFAMGDALTLYNETLADFQ